MRKIGQSLDDYGGEIVSAPFNMLTQLLDRASINFKGSASNCNLLLQSHLIPLRVFRTVPSLQRHGTENWKQNTPRKGTVRLQS